jgi:protein-disulfide isomerase
LCSTHNLLCNFLKKSLVFFCLVVAALFSCEGKKPSQQVAATINGQSVTVNEIDQIVKYQLHERLYDIYKIRKIALDELIEQKLMLEESAARGITIDSLRSLEITSKINEQSLEQFIKDNDLQAGVMEPDNPFKYVDIKTERGQKLLHDAFHARLRDDFIEKLKTKYGVDVQLSPPKAPVIVDELLRYPLNARSESKTITIDYIGDLDCDACRAKTPVLFDLIKKYDDKIQFNYIPMVAMPSISTTIGSVCNNKGNFLDLLRVVHEMSPMDSAGYLYVAGKLGISKADLQVKNEEEHTKLQQNFLRLSVNKVTSTPTILVNGGIFYGVIAEQSLEEYLELYFSVEPK